MQYQQEGLSVEVQPPAVWATHGSGEGVPHEVWRAFQPYHQILSMLKHVRGVKGRNNL